MGLTVKQAFTAGELDPVLHERTTIDKYKTGMATARNVVVSKTGSVLSRPGRIHFQAAKLDDSFIRIYSPPGSGLILEWGHLYVRQYTLGGIYVGESASLLTATDLLTANFETSGTIVYIFVSGKEITKFFYTDPLFANFADQTGIFALPGAPASVSIAPAGTPTGYKVEYAMTLVFNGQEGSALVDQGNVNLPIAAGQSNPLDINCYAGTATTGLSEVRIYRRPKAAGAYGYIGSTSSFSISGGNVHASFTDLGQDADYTHSFPTLITPSAEDPINLLSKTGIIYQQRLLITDTTLDLEAIYASQPGFQNNFYRNYPLDSASALKFKAGTSGYGRVLRMLDNDGLVVFTSAGVYINQGDLTPDNLSLARKGRWVINDSMPPLAIPGGCMFVDNSTNSIRNLVFNWQSQTFSGEEMSIYSGHLFRQRVISAWNFQEGIFPLLWVVFSDGTFVSFTFENDEQMKAWTRHDSDPVIKLESCCETINPDTSFFVVKKTINGVVKRYIEYTNSRYVPPIYIAIDPDYKMNPSIAYMDSLKSFATLLNNSLKTGESFLLDTTTPNEDWSIDLNLSCGTSGIFGVAGVIVGATLRCFDSDGSAYDLKIKSITDSNNCVVTPDQLFPSTMTPRLYLTSNTFSGLDYLEGESPAVIVDGGVVCSPNNDVDNYDVATVTGGVLTLPNSMLGAIVHVGRPIIGDVETLDIDTVEQSPTLIESLDVNKLYIKVHNSKGLFVSNKFPDKDGSVKDMVSLESLDLGYNGDDEIIGNRAQPEKTKRIEATLPGDWKSQGKICIRQVDPLHFEILSIIPDCEILTRSDR